MIEGYNISQIVKKHLAIKIDIIRKEPPYIRSKYVGVYTAYPDFFPGLVEDHISSQSFPSEHYSKSAYVNRRRVNMHVALYI